MSCSTEDIHTFKSNIKNVKLKQKGKRDFKTKQKYKNKESNFTNQDYGLLIHSAEACAGG